MESHESTRQRVESLQSKGHEGRIAGKGFTSLTRYNLVHKFIPMPQAMKIPDANSAVDKNRKSLKQFPHGIWKSSHQEGGYAGLMDICHFKNAELEPKLQKYKGRVVLPGDIVKDDSGHTQFLLNRAHLR